MRQIHTFIIRVLHDENDETFHGQVSEPASDDEWRASFAGLSDLWTKLKQRLGKDSAVSDDPSLSQEK